MRTRGPPIGDQWPRSLQERRLQAGCMNALAVPALSIDRRRVRRSTTKCRAARADPVGWLVVEDELDPDRRPHRRDRLLDRQRPVLDTRQLRGTLSGRSARDPHARHLRPACDRGDRTREPARLDDPRDRRGRAPVRDVERPDHPLPPRPRPAVAASFGGTSRGGAPPAPPSSSASSASRRSPTSASRPFAQRSPRSTSPAASRFAQVSPPRPTPTASPTSPGEASGSLARPRSWRSTSATPTRRSPWRCASRCGAPRRPARAGTFARSRP